MNANELADKIEDARNETDFQKWAGQAPDMLRQQQAEIANLKAGLLSHHDIYPVKEQELLGEIAQLKAELDTANKAYMWMDETYRGVLAELGLLKAHPTELTDEEIISTMVQFDVYSSDDHLLIEAGRAILRKAQEK